jgi:signal transduction histidine kinase
MKKVAVLFVLAVVVPSLVLAWLAVRTLRDQEFLLERQQSLLYQGVTDGLARDVQNALADDLHAFTAKVGSLLKEGKAQELARSFDDRLRQEWPLAHVGFVVTLTGELLAPSPLSRPEARVFIDNNNRFLANRESAEVYLNAGPGNNKDLLANSVANSQAPSDRSEFSNEYGNRLNKYKTPQTRSVVPQQQVLAAQKPGPQQEQQQYSKLAPSEAEFRQLIGEDTEGMLARFVDNKLSVLLWCRAPADPQLIFGAQLDIARLKTELGNLLQQLEPALRDSLCIALLDDNARPAAVSRQGFQANWKRPFVATEIGDALPHWEAAAYLLDPARLARSAHALKLTLGLLIGLLLVAIGTGSWLIVADLNRQLLLARQKTDFVSNVSHELKTPLTSIRMFSELLAEGRIADAAKQRSYLAIIAAETARLTRLINNVLDFARAERGEKKYRFQECDLVQLVRELSETYRPHLEAEGFRFECVLPEAPVLVNGDRDALAQIILNLLSNAEKYSSATKEILVRVESHELPLPHVELAVLDRGLGVPAGSEQKIFEKFYRAHDSLSSGIQGSGLGLTLARQIARAHGGEVVYKAREGGGSCFCLRLPLQPSAAQNQNNP